MDQHVGVFRTRQGLEEMAAGIPRLRERLARAQIDDRSRTFNTELVQALELEFMLDGAETIVHSALAREESRGSHARRDFPNRDDDRYLAHSMAYYRRSGSPRPRTVTRRTTTT